MKNVFLISGKLQSGKNQFAKYLEDFFKKDNRKVVNDYFAKDVKEECYEDFKLIYDFINESIQNYYKSFKFYKAIGDTNLKDCNEVYKSDILENLLINSKDNFFEDKTPLTRKMLQVYGTNIFRNRVNKNYWVDKLINRLIDSDIENFLITDVRFPNEIERLYKKLPEDFNIITIRIERENKEDNNLNHESESALDNKDNMFHYIIDNNKDLRQLNDSAKLVFNDLKNFDTF